MEFASPHQSFTREVVARGLLKSAPFCLVDVGCSGGIAPLWRAFEPSLRTIGIDPVIAECARLNARETNDSVRYIPAFVGLPDDHPFNLARHGQPPTQRNPWSRLSAGAASAILTQRVSQDTKLPVLNDWQGESLTTVTKHSLQELAIRAGLANLDFIKIDIDGNDLEALHSAEPLIRESPVLGLVLEVNYYGGTGPHEHTFHNTDRLMRAWGFDLFGITARRYSNAAMPNRFEYECPAQTVSGRPYQGDALYLRDAIGLAESLDAHILSPDKLLKLVCLFESFCLPDFAAELVLKHAAVIGIDPDNSLELLTRGVRNDGVPYREHLRRFQEDPSRFYPGGPM